MSYFQKEQTHEEQNGDEIAKTSRLCYVLEEFAFDLLGKHRVRGSLELTRNKDNRENQLHINGARIR